MLERGPLAVEPLSDAEARVLGVQQQDVDDHTVRMSLRAIPGRAIVIDTERSPDGQCRSSTEMTIAGVPAKVASVFVQQRLFGVKYVLVTGWSADGAVVREQIKL